MRRVIYYCIIISFALYASTFGATSKIGVGFILGDPSGFTAKFFMDKSDALDVGVGESADDLYIYGDYLRHFYNVLPVPELKLYIGVGAGFHNFEKENRNDHSEENRIDIRVPFGIEYTFTKVPIGIFLELVPALRIIPDIDFELRGGLGARYYF